MERIYARLSDVLIDVFDDDALVATPELSARDVPGWDSFAHVRFVLAVERAFGVHFTASEIASFKKVGDVAVSVSKKNPSLLEA